MRYQELMKEMNAGIFHPVYLFSGPEQYIGAMMEKNLIKKVVAEELIQLNTMSFSDKETDIASVTAICRQLPMMSEYRVVVLREETGIAHSSDATVIENLCAYLEHPEPTTLLIIYDTKPDKRKKLYKTLVKKAAVVDFGKLSEMELEKWIARRLKLAGKKTSRTVVRRFMEDTRYLLNDDQNMERVDHELGKIMDYVGERDTITPQDLDATLPKSIDENIYNMVNFAMAGNMGQALRMLGNFYLEGESPFGVFGLLISHLRTMLQVRIMTDDKNPQQAIAKAVGRPAFVVKKMQATSQKFPLSRLRQIFGEAAKLDLQMKTGVVDPEMGVELFILRLS